MRGQSSLITTVSVGATTPVVIVPSRVNRAALIIFNVAGTLYLKYGVEGQIPPWTVQLGVKEDVVIENFTGSIMALKATSTSDVYVTEIW